MNYSNTIAEHYIASAILNEPERIIPKLNEENITAEYFHEYMPRWIYSSCMKLYKKNRTHEIELFEFSDEVKGLANGRELTVDISRIRSEYCGWELGKQHLNTVKEKHAERSAYTLLQDTMQSLKDGVDVVEVADASKEIANSVFTILETNSGYKNAKQSAEEFTDLLREIHSKKSTSGTTSGIAQLDKYTGGLGSNELWVVAAETSGGKTVLMFQIMAAFLELGKNVLLFSLETDASRIHARLAANTQNISLSKILGTGIEPLIKNDIRRLQTYIEDVIESNCLTICDADDITMETITAKADQVHSSGKAIDLIVVDYIQLVTVLGAKDRNRQEQVAEVSRSLKQLAKRYNCPVITASQLNDDGKVRESRAITHDADVFLRIGKDSDYVYIGKNRNGERNVKLELILNGAYQRFENV